MPIDAARVSADAQGQGTGLAKGATLGRYVVLGLLGRGGMGEVYAAYDPELDRKIAIKLLRTRDGSSPEDASQGRTRLLREAQAIARLSHPNVVVVFDVGTFEGAVFVAMEFIQGHTVGYWLHAGARGWREVLKVFLAAGRGLVAAHEAGIVHRDFKPDNVMITSDGQVRVMDFGLARQLLGTDDEPEPPMPDLLGAATAASAFAEAGADALDPEATANLGTNRATAPGTTSGGYLRLKLTQTGAILGTPAYMAPEQFGGKQGDARADQFSFCVALYEALYGRRPFEGQDLVSLMTSVVGGEVGEPPPEARVPAWIRRVLLRGLRSDPEQRYPSMAALLAALEQDPASRRRRLSLFAMTGILLAGLGAGARHFSAGQRAICAGAPDRVATAWGPSRREEVLTAFATAGKSRAEQAFSGAASLIDQYLARWSGMYRDACEATHVRGEQSADVLDLRMGCLGERLGSVRALTEVFARADAGVVDNAVAAAAALPTLDRCADVPILRAVLKPPDDPALLKRVGALREDIAKVQALSASGQCERALTAGRAAVDSARAVGYLPLRAEAEFALGRLADNCADLSSSIDMLEDAALSAEASHHDEVAIEASAFVGGEYADRAHDVRMGGHWIRLSEAILARFPGHPVLESWVAVAKGTLFHAQARDEDSLREHRRALALKEKVFGADHVDPATSAMNVALTLHDLGRDVEAEPLIGGSVSVLRKYYGPDSGQLALALLNQCEVLTALRKFADAHAAIERALAIWSGRDASPIFVGYGTFDLGRLQLAEGNSAAARVTLERAVGLLGKADAQTAAEAEFALARALWASPPDRARALALAQRARAVIAGGAGAARRLTDLDAWLQTRR